VGKTTLLQQIHDTYDKNNVLWYSFDVFGYDHHWDDKLFWQEVHSAIHPQIQAICCDEIQMMPNWHMLINALHTKYPQIQLYIT
jgi:predicted AAA+ superfamily ATPase